MAVRISPVFNDQTFAANNVLAAGYKLFTYVAGSTTKLTTYTDSTGATPQTNPIILNALGYPTNGQIWLSTGQSYKFVLAGPTDTDPPTSPIKTIDGVTGVNDSSTTITQWVSSGLVPTYLSATTFSLVGDQTTEFHVGRRLKFTTSGGTVYGTISATAYTVLTTVTMTMDSPGVLDAGLSAIEVSILRSDYPAIPGAVDSRIQKQTATYFTTSLAGTYSLTPIPAISANTAGTRFNVTFNATCPAAPTLSVSGLAAQPLVYFAADGSLKPFAAGQITAGLMSDVVSHLGNWVVVTPAPTSQSKIQTIGATVAGNAMTISAGYLALDFRSTTAGSGAITTVCGTPADLVISAGSTLGTTSGQSARLIVLAINNAGTIELAVSNQSGAANLGETGTINTSAEGGAGGADNASNIYSTTARGNVAYRVIGYIDTTQATAGTWATAPTAIQGQGGQAISALSSLGYGQLWQSVTRTSGVGYFNLTGRPIVWLIMLPANSTVSAVTVQGINQGTLATTAATTLSASFIIPPGASYAHTVTAGSTTSNELR